MTESEAFLQRFHAGRPGSTSAALARTGIYQRFAARVPAGRVLDVGCGDGALVAHLEARGDAGRTVVGIDLCGEDLVTATRAGARVVQGRARALPFADAAFEAVTCQLAFMLFDEVERVVAELARVLVPGGVFLALLGGGPTAEGQDAFHAFLELLGEAGAGVDGARPLESRALGDPRARTEAGWRALFAGWTTHAFERWELDASGTFDEVWAFLGSSYQLPPRLAPELRARLAARFSSSAEVPCRVVTWFARADRPAGI